MRPISLTLKGFRGIRDGLGRDVIELDFERLTSDAQLIAIVGSNGRGKTTVMDNMTPLCLLRGFLPGYVSTHPSSNREPLNLTGGRRRASWWLKKTVAGQR